ncbi:MAG: hypothetical protein Q7J23_06545 [Nitrosomonas sp.]|nr:hypothetical protein [Nitrosomonas sp.]
MFFSTATPSFVPQPLPISVYGNSLQHPHWSFGLQPEIDVLLAAKQLPARPDEINKKAPRRHGHWRAPTAHHSKH